MAALAKLSALGWWGLPIMLGTGGHGIASKAGARTWLP